MKKYIERIGYLGLGLYITFGAILMTVISMAIESDPVTVTKVGNDFTVAYSGERKSFTRKVCSDKKRTVVVTRNIFYVDENGVEYRAGDMPLAGYGIGPGCRQDDYFLPIPDDYKPGIYIYRPILTYDINPMQTKYSKPLEEIVFTVIKRDSK